MSRTARVYGGIDATDRTSERRSKLLASGLELLGSPGTNNTLTVRGVCKEAGLVARYFYESFEDSDALVVAVYDDVIQELTLTTLAALAEAPADERGQIGVGLDAIVGLIVDDPRKGRLLFGAAVTHPALSQKRLETTRLFSGLLTEQAQTYYGIEAGGTLRSVSRFLVGGLGETLTAWQHDDLDLTRDELVELCTELFLSSARLALGREDRR